MPREQNSPDTPGPTELPHSRHTDDPMDDHTRDCLAAARAGAARASAGFRADLDAERKGDGVDSVTAADRAAQRVVTDRLAADYPAEPVVGEEGSAPDRVPASSPAWVVDPIDGTVNFVGGHPVWATSVARVVDGEPVAAATVAPALNDAYVADETTAWREPAGVTAVEGDDGDAPGDAHDAVGDTSDAAGDTSDAAGDTDRTRLSVAAESDPGQFLVNPLFGPSASDRAAFAAVAEPLLTRFGDLRRLGCAQLVLAGVASGQLHAAVSTVELNDWDTVAGVHLVRLAGGRVTDAAGDRWTPGATGLVASNGRAHEELLAVTRE